MVLRDLLRKYPADRKERQLIPMTALAVGDTMPAKSHFQAKPDQDKRPSWQRELSEWLIVVMTMGISGWLFFTLGQLLIEFTSALSRLIGLTRNF